MASTTPSPNLIVAAGVIWPLVDTIAVVLRFSSRRMKSARPAVDDWLTIPALILLWGQCACLLVGVYTRAMGYPTPPPPAGFDRLTYNCYESEVIRQLFWALLLMQIPGLTLIKCSFVFLYRRFFVRNLRGTMFGKITWIIVAILIAWAVAFFFSELFLCRLDFESIWITKTLTTKETSLIDINQWDIAYTSSDFVLDLIVFILPIRPIMRSKLSPSQKFSVLGVFALGGLAIAASVTRLAVFVPGDKHYSYLTTDTNLFITTIAYWSVVESGLALLASCLPSVYGLFNLLRQKRKGDGSFAGETQVDHADRSQNMSTWFGHREVTTESNRRNPRIQLSYDVMIDIEQGSRKQAHPKWEVTQIEVAK